MEMRIPFNPYVQTGLGVQTIINDWYKCDLKTHIDGPWFNL